MQLLSKNKSSGGHVAFAPWHPNFRDKATLPDIKTVRTRFFINAAGVAVAVCAALFYVYSEYQYRVLDNQLTQLKKRVESASKPSKDAIAQYKKFSAEEAKLKEYVAFVKGEKLNFTDFLLALGQVSPTNITVNTVQYNAVDVRVRGTIKGASDQAAGVASSYEKLLRDTPDIVSKFDSIALSSVTRDPGTGAVNFEIVFKFKKS